MKKTLNNRNKKLLRISIVLWAIAATMLALQILVFTKDKGSNLFGSIKFGNQLFFAEQPIDEVTVGVGQGYTLSAKVGGDGEINYNWRGRTVPQNKEVALNSTTNQLKVPTLLSGETWQSYEFWLEASNGQSLVTSNVAKVLVTSEEFVNPPTIEMDLPARSNVALNSQFKLSIEATGENLTYQWFRVNANGYSSILLTGATSDTYTVPTNALGDFKYYVVATSNSTTAAKSRTSNLAHVSVKPLNYVDNVLMVDANSLVQSVEVGDNVEMAVYTMISGLTLTFQWYVNSVPSTLGATLLDKKSTAVLTVVADKIGKLYYFAKASFVQNGESKFSESELFEIDVQRNELYSPVIQRQPQQSEIIGKGEILRISVSVKPTEGGELSYQWYKNQFKTTDNATPIANANSDSFLVPSSEHGTNYYFVVVSNTYDANVYMTTSMLSAITVAKVAEVAKIEYHPSSTQSFVHQEFNLNVGASVEFGKLRYQWYKNTENTNSGGELLQGETSSILTISLVEQGVYYYYVKITNEDNINIASTVASRVALVLIKDNDSLDDSQQNSSGLFGNDNLLPSIVVGFASVGVLVFAIFLLRKKRDKHS